jgi:hypothetical protein
MYRIEQGIPIPPKKSRSRRYPLLDMERGDSFYIPGRRSVGGSLKFVQEAHKNLKFTTRFDGKGVRVWRIK